MIWKFVWIAALLGAGALSACVPVELEREDSVVLQALAADQAFVELADRSEGLVLEVRGAERQLLARAQVPFANGNALFDELRGRLDSVSDDRGIIAIQKGRIKKDLAGLQGAPEFVQNATQGDLEIEAMRVITFDRGVLKREIEGAVRLVLRDDRGLPVSSHEARINRSNRSGTTVIAPRVRGYFKSLSIPGMWDLGLGRIEADAAIAIPAGLGRLTRDGVSQGFSVRLPPQAKPVRKRLTGSEDYLEYADLLVAGISLSCGDCAQGKPASGKGQLFYDLVLAIDPTRVLFHGKAHIEGHMANQDGFYAEFMRQDGDVETELAW